MSEPPTDRPPAADGPDPQRSPIARRKAQHLDVVIRGEAEPGAPTTLLEQVHLVHQALPERALAGVDLTTRLLGRTLSAPLVITGMTGGTAAAGRINRELAAAAERLGIGFGVGSQRAMAEHPELEDSFQVRDAAPRVFLIGNLGVVQARQLGMARVARLVDRIGADAMAIHLNPAMELIQERGDRDFSGALDTLAALVDTLPVPIVVKETGCGLSAEAAHALREIGVPAVDVSGAGGTSFVAIEGQRAAPGSPGHDLARELAGWGIPTAVSVALAAGQGLEVIASGGLRSGLDLARALALGATAGGLAGPVLRAHHEGGEEAVVALIERLIAALRAIALLCGASCVADLAGVPRHLDGELRRWIDDLRLR
jgi:isopentenyl-diphosphate delta-isomerase